MSTANEIAERHAARPEEQNPRPVLLMFYCPGCQQTNRQEIRAGEEIRCRVCGWSRTCSSSDFQHHKPIRCLVCNCDDLWPQKDFPQRLGLMTVGLAIVLSTIAYALWQPAMALGILMLFALVDCLLFVFMRSVLVCYRCRARHGGFDPAPEQKAFNLEVHERYRQEHMRLEAVSRRPS